MGTDDACPHWRGTDIEVIRQPGGPEGVQAISRTVVICDLRPLPVPVAMCRACVRRTAKTAPSRPGAGPG